MRAIDLQHLLVLPSASDGGAGRYVDWWVVHVSVANLLVIVLMVLTFVAALLLPFPRGGNTARGTSETSNQSTPERPEADR